MQFVSLLYVFINIIPCKGIHISKPGFRLFAYIKHLNKAFVLRLLLNYVNRLLNSFFSESLLPLPSRTKSIFNIRFRFPS